MGAFGWGRAVDKVAAAGASAMRMKASAGASAGANGAPNSLRETIASAMTRGGGAVGASAAGEAAVNAAVTSVTKGAEAASTAASAEGRSLIWRAAAFHYGLLARLARAVSTEIAVGTTTTMLGFIIGAFMCAYSQRVVKKRFVEALAKMRGRKGDQSAQPTKLSWLESRKLKMGKDREQQEVLPLADEFKKLFSMHAPKWTSDSSFNRVHWLNRVIDAMWAHIDTGVSRTVKESVEPTLRELAPSCVTWIGFEKFTLGPRAPTLSGIRSHNSHMENTILDVELTWASDCEIIVSVYFFGLRLPITLRQLQIKALLQVTLDPLVDIMPCLGAIEACLMGMPEVLDFGLFLPGGIDLISIPFVHKMMKNIVRNSISTMLIYPYKVHIPIMEHSGIEKASTGIMRVRFLQGDNFYKRCNYSKLSRKRKQRSGFFTQMLKSDNYYIKYWTREQRVLTTPPRTGDSPSWQGVNDTFILCDRDSTLSLRLVKSGADRISNYGEVQFKCGEIADRGPGPVVVELPFIDPEYFMKECPLTYLNAADGYTYEETMERFKQINEWHLQAAKDADEKRLKYFYRCFEQTKDKKKKDKNHPTIRMEVEYIDTGPPDEVVENYEQGMLTVELIEGRNLLRVADRPPSPVAIVSCAKQRYVGTRRASTSHPIFNERHVFYNVLPDVDPLKIEIQGSDGESLGHCEIDVDLVRQNVYMRDEVKLEGVAKGEVLVILQYSPMASETPLDRTASC